MQRRFLCLRVSFVTLSSSGWCADGEMENTFPRHLLESTLTGINKPFVPFSGSIQSEFNLDLISEPNIKFCVPPSRKLLSRLVWRQRNKFSFSWQIEIVKHYSKFIGSEAPLDMILENNLILRLRITIAELFTMDLCQIYFPLHLSSHCRNPAANTLQKKLCHEAGTICGRWKWFPRHSMKNTWTSIRSIWSRLWNWSNTSAEFQVSLEFDAVSSENPIPNHIINQREIIGFKSKDTYSCWNVIQSSKRLSDFAEA